MKFYYYILSSLIAIGLFGCDRNNSQSTINNFLDYLPFFSKSEACKGLHKIIDVDDLVQQMYANIDSTCLFDMPAGELEKVWDIKVFDDAELYKINDVKRLEARGEDKRKYREQGRSIFVVREIDYIQVWTTNVYDNQFPTWQGRELATGKIPSYLPKFDSKKFIEDSNSHYLPNEIKSQGNDASSTSFSRNVAVIWLNTEKSEYKPALMIYSGNKSYGRDILFYKEAKNAIYFTILFPKN